MLWDPENFQHQISTAKGATETDAGPEFWNLAGIDARTAKPNGGAWERGVRPVSKDCPRSETRCVRATKMSG